MVNIWKPKEKKIIDEWNKANNLRNQSKWNDAAKAYYEVYELSTQVSDYNLKQLGLIALAMSYLMSLKVSLSREKFEQLYNVLKSLNPEQELEIPYKVKVKEILPEVEVFKELMSLEQVSIGSKPSNSLQLSKGYEDVAKKFFLLNKTELALGDLLGIKYSSTQLGYYYMGISRYLIAVSQEDQDPQAALEKYSEALNYFVQIGDSNWKGYIEDRVNKLSKLAKCWFCGRVIQGEGIHFVYLETFLSNYLISKNSESPSSIQGNTKLVACEGCYNAISKLADAIAKYYYQITMEKIKELENRIRSLEARVSMIRVRV
ncbi:MAG: hypothetical protein QXV69_09160 [Sulfolobaceae archaeon]